MLLKFQTFFMFIIVNTIVNTHLIKLKLLRNKVSVILLYRLFLFKLEAIKILNQYNNQIIQLIKKIMQYVLTIFILYVEQK